MGGMWEISSAWVATALAISRTEKARNARQLKEVGSTHSGLRQKDAHFLPIDFSIESQSRFSNLLAWPPLQIVSVRKCITIEAEIIT